jgi:HEAT repeat protein
MADSTLNKVIQLIAGKDNGELRLAAIQVGGAIGTAKERGLVKAILGALDDADPGLRTTAIAALGRLQVEEALPRLVELVRQGGPEADTAARAASQLGAKGARAMGKIMHDAVPALRSRIAAVLAKTGGQSALVITAHALLDEDPKVVEAATRSLAVEMPTYSQGERHLLAKFLREALQDRKAKHPPRTEAALLRVLGALHEVKAEDMFWGRILPPTHPEVRAAALHALGNLGARVNDARVQRLVMCASDSDFQIVASALMLLKQVPGSAKTAKHWLKLLNGPDVAARRFAVERLHGIESKDAAKSLVFQATHPDRALRDEALAALRSFPAGRETLLDKILTAASHDECWTLARAFAPTARQLTKAQRAKLLEHACDFHEHDDRRASPLWFLLREIDHDWTRDRLIDRAESLRQKKKYAEALGYYRLLAQDPACSEDTRFGLAATGLKLSGHDQAVEARQNDPALHQFGRLLQNPDFNLIGHVAKAKWLDPEDLFYLGFHFAEQTHHSKEFGKEVLELVVKRSPKSEIGKQAKRKLKSEALI